MVNNVTSFAKSLKVVFCPVARVDFLIILRGLLLWPKPIEFTVFIIIFLIRAFKKNGVGVEAKPLSIILSSTEVEKVHTAAMFASLTSLTDRPVKLFVGLGSIQFFTKSFNPGRQTGKIFFESIKKINSPNFLELLIEGKDLGALSIFACPLALEVASCRETDLVENLFDGILGMMGFISESTDCELVVF